MKQELEETCESISLSLHECKNLKRERKKGEIKKLPRNLQLRLVVGVKGDTEKSQRVKEQYFNA